MRVIECSICLEPVRKNPVDLHCRHMFHHECLVRHCQLSPCRHLCPYCRSQILVVGLDLTSPAPSPLVVQVNIWFDIPYTNHNFSRHLPPDAVMKRKTPHLNCYIRLTLQPLQKKLLLTNNMPRIQQQLQPTAHPLQQANPLLQIMKLCEVTSCWSLTV